MATRKQSGKTSQPKKIQLGENVFIDQATHDQLLRDINERCLWANQARSQMCDRFELVDREVAGFLVLDEDDKKRQRDNAKGYGVKPVDVKLPLVFTQMDESVTLLMAILAPDEGIYQAAAAKDKQRIAKAFTTLMNQHAQIFGHYRQLCLGVFNAMKYNFGGWVSEWEEIRGNKIANSSPGSTLPEVKEATLRAGNTIPAIDVYNFLWDISVAPCDVATMGEFFAVVERITSFRLRQRINNKLIYGDFKTLSETGGGDVIYYRAPPDVNSPNGLGARSTDWKGVLAGNSGGTTSPGEAHDLMHFYWWVMPEQYNQINDTDKAQVWKFTIKDGQRLVAAEHLTNAHGLLPCAIASPMEDGLGLQTKSFAELLVPYQQFASFQINVHQRAARKALYGITIYNKNKLPLMEQADPLCAKVPTRGDVDDVGKIFKQVFDAPNTENTMRDVDAMVQMMQKILPTDQLKQVTDLQRATKYQAAATVQGSNRRNLKIAKIIDSQALVHLRMMQMYNVLQFQQSVELIDDNGEIQEVNPAEFRDANLEFEIGDGLKGLDKLTLIETIKEVANMVLQSANANDKLDIVEVINYLTTLVGDKTDFAQFKYKNEFDKLNMQQKEMAFQLLQGAMQKQQEAQNAGKKGMQSNAAPGGQP